MMTLIRKSLLVWQFVAAVLVLSLLILCSCSANRQQVRNAAATAVLVTDAALENAIPNEVDADEDAKWEAMVSALEVARDVVDADGDLCSAMDGVRQVAESLKCSRCVSAVDSAAVMAGCD